MALTDHCDVFGAFHEEGFNRIIDHIRFQRPSMFNYATQAIADNPGLLCGPIVAHPRLNQHGNPLVTLIDPLPLPGTNFALNFSVQLVDVKIDFHPPNVVSLPPELAPLAGQRFAISLRVCAGIGCPPAQAVGCRPPPAGPGRGPEPAASASTAPGRLARRPATDLRVPSRPTQWAGSGSRSTSSTSSSEPFVDRIEISPPDRRPRERHRFQHCATLRLGFLPKLRILLEKMALDITDDVSISVQPKPVAVTPQVPNNPAVGVEVRAFIDLEVGLAMPHLRVAASEAAFKKLFDRVVEKFIFEKADSKDCCHSPPDTT